MFIVTPIVGVCNCSMFCCTLLYVHSSIAITLMGKRELIALLNLSSWCLVMVERLFLAVPRGCLQFVIVVFPDHTLLLFLFDLGYSHLRVRIPDSWGIFQLGSYKGVISRFTNLRHLSFYISPDKPKSPICIGSYTVDMGIPGETTGDINPEIPGTWDRLQNLSM